MSSVYLALLHYPVYNKKMEVIATSITNLDIHDIARSSRTYGIQKYILIHPYEAQIKLTKSILEYWQEGYGARYNSDRKEAFSLVEMLPSLNDAVSYIRDKEGTEPKLITTDARVYPNSVSYKVMRDKIAEGSEPYLIVFGTGWGIEEKTMQTADYILEPIYGSVDYNHLSVRSAVAIILDRLLGEDWWSGS